MRFSFIPFPTVLAGFVAVLVGYASSAAIIWQAAAAAGASALQISGWMTALGLAMGVSTLVLTLWRKVPILTAWSTPGAALLVGSLQGATLNDAVGIFIFANALIVLCGLTGWFARLMKLIPHSLAAAMLAGILLRFGLQAFSTLEGHLILCGSMLVGWLLFKALAPRYAVVAALVVGMVVAALKGDIVTQSLSTAIVMPQFITPHFSITGLLSIGIPFFLVTMALAKCAGAGDVTGFRLQGPRFTADCNKRRIRPDTRPVGCLFRVYSSNYCRYLPKPRCAPRSGQTLACGSGCRGFLSDCGSIWRVDYGTDGRITGSMDSDARRAGAAQYAGRQPVPVIKRGG